MASKDLAERLLIEEEKNKQFKNLFKGMETNLTNISGFLKEQNISIKNLEDALTPAEIPIQDQKILHWYQTGEVTLANAGTAEKAGGNLSIDYDTHNYFISLNKPSQEGSIVNLGPSPGNIFILSSWGDKTSVNEMKLGPYDYFVWDKEDGYDVYIMYVRTDTAGTKYQILCG